MTTKENDAVFTPPVLPATNEEKDVALTLTELDATIKENDEVLTPTALPNKNDENDTGLTSTALSATDKKNGALLTTCKDDVSLNEFAQIKQIENQDQPKTSKDELVCFLIV